MKDDKLDRILSAGLDEDPPDDGFTQRVVGMIAGRKRGWARFVTRPALIAAAAVFISSAALATVAVNEPIAGSIRREVGKVIRGEESPSPASPKKEKRRDERKQDPGAQPPERSPDGAQRTTRGERGYASSHTAYTSDGVLRLETETYANEVQAGSIHKVTISIKNVSSDPVTIYSPEGCMLAASATFSGGQRDESADRSDYGRMTCAGSGEDPRAQSETSQRPVEIAPGETIAADVSIEFPQQGEWTVLGHCFCRRESSSASPSPRPSPKPSPSRSPGQVPLGDLSLPLSSPSPGSSPSERPSPGGSQGATTPPIRVVAV